MKNSFIHLLLTLLVGSLSVSSAGPIISEFLASNDSELADEDGDFSDWIEIYNPDAVAVSMNGWHLTDEADNLDKWTFPNVTIPAGGYLVVFASNKDHAVAGSELHTDFKLSSSGEYLALVMPDGATTTSEFNPFPAQNTDISYGIDNTIALLGSTAPLSYVLAAPANDGAGKAWTEYDFDDSGWTDTRQGTKIYHSSEIPRTATKGSWSNNSGEATSTLTISGQSSPISEMKLHFDVTQSSNSSLQISIRSPQGPTTGISPSENPTTLTQYNNQNLNGTWTFKILESGGGFFGSATTTLNGWSLEIPGGTEPAIAGIGYDNGTDYDSLINTPIPSGTTEAWVRFPFQVSDPSELSGLLMRLRFDDGFEAYLNGVLVASNNNVEPITAGDSADYVDFDLAAHQSALRAGDNVLAIRVINASSSSSDLLLVPELVANGAVSSSSYALLPDPSPGVANQGGALNPGPIISEVTENPAQPGDADNLLVTANIQQRQAGVASVNLLYRRDYDSEITLSMVDDGTGGDTLAGDGVYSAMIPASASNQSDMLRWRVEAEDTGGLKSTLPLLIDTSGNSRSPEYYGTVVKHPSIDQGLPIMHWFTQDVSNSRSRTGARASVYYEGKFYDNIYVRQRGGYTNSGSQKFDFNKGHPLYASEELDSVGEVNMNGNGSDSSYVRQSLGFNFFNEAGAPGCESFPVQMRLNGSFDRVGILIEQVDEDYLKRFGYDEDDGELYKFVQRSNLNPALDDVSTGVERKTGDENDLSSVQSLVDDLKQSSSDARITSYYDNVDVQEFVNYMAIRCVLQMADDVRKNFYLYKDASGDGRWRILPWDLDWNFGIVGGHGSTRVEHPFFGTQAFPTDDGANQWNRLYNVAFESLEMQRLYLRRVRSLMDSRLKSSPTGSWFETRADEIYNSMSGLSGPSSSNYTSLRNTEIPERRSDLYTEMTTTISGMSVVIPASQPVNPAVMIDEVDFSPASGDQDQEYIRIANTENTEIDISGWSLSSGVTFTFPAGTVIPRNGEIYVSPRLSKFVTRSVSPTASEKRLVTGPYNGHLSSFGEDIVLMNDAGGIVQTFSYVGNPSLAQQYLKIIQIHYAPISNPDAEFIELMNISGTETIDLTGVQFVNGIDFDFTGSGVTSLAPFQRVLVVKNIAAFESVYGTMLSPGIAGEFANGTSLDNGGEAIKLDDASGSTIVAFSYDNEAPWPYKAGHSIIFDLGYGFSGPPPIEPDPGNPTDWYVSGGVEGEPFGASALFRPWLASRGQTDPLTQVNGWSELLNYALGRDLAGDNFIYKLAIETDAGESGFGFSMGGVGDEEDEEDYYLTLEATIRASKDVTVVVQTSTDMVAWADANNVTELWSSENGDGTLNVKYQIGDPLVLGQKLFTRLIVRE